MSIRKRDVHFSDWTKVRHALVCNNVHGITETSSFDDVRTFLINSESGSNPFYYYVCYIKETKEIYTHGQFYDCLKSGDSVIPEKIEELESTLGTKVDLTVFEELQSDVKENELVTARALTELNEKKADSVDLNAIKAEIEENEKVAAKAFMDLNERKLDKSELDNIDLSNYVDLDTYYNNLNTTNSSINLKADKTTVDLLQTTVYLKANQTDLDTLSAEVEENEDVTAAALTELHENKADKTDLEDYAKQDDLNTKQDQLVSGTTIKTVNGNTILGSGNIETPDTKVTSADNHYGYNSDNATSTTGAFVTKITKDAANHVTSFESRALTATDIPELDASKITTGEISIDRLPKGALERLFVVESEAAAISATVQEGDVVQVTGNNNKMYFCISNTATTFATKFKEFTAGTATSVPWSGITGKPTGIDGWGDRIGVIESGYATQSWVGENYLSKSGGTISDLIIDRNPSVIQYKKNGASVGYLGIESELKPVIYNAEGNTAYTILHSGNYSDYALSVNGGTVNGSVYMNGYFRLGNSQPIMVADTNGVYQSALYLSTGNNFSIGYGTSVVGKRRTQLFGNTIEFKSNGGEDNTLVLNADRTATFSSTVSAQSFIGNLVGVADKSKVLGDYYGERVTSANLDFTDSAVRKIIATTSMTTAKPPADGSILHFAWDNTGGWNHQLFISSGGESYPDRRMAWRSQHYGSWGEWKPIAFTDSNVASATKLATPRTIWGQSFDGTGDITGPLHLGNNISIRCYSTSGSEISTLILDQSNTLLLGYDMSNIGGTVLYGKALAMRYGASRTMGFLLNEYGNVAIGGTTADEKLHIYGNVKASGSMYAVDFATTSDNRLKDFVSDIYVDFESIKQIPKKYYYWKDKSMGEDLQLGTSAQELAKIYPECVHYDETNDRYSVNYQKLSIVALAAIDKLHDRISELESKLYDKNN